MATIQTTQLEERETGDIKQLRDHDIAEGPVSTNSADATSLKSVPLTLEDGSIIKVRFDSLVTAIGQALGASEDSTVTKVLGLNGTVPKGINMANLASVLGGEGYTDLSVVAGQQYRIHLGYKPIVFRTSSVWGWCALICCGWNTIKIYSSGDSSPFAFSADGDELVFSSNETLGAQWKFI